MVSFKIKIRILFEIKPLILALKEYSKLKMYQVVL